MKTHFIFILLFQLLIASCMQKNTDGTDNGNSKQEFFSTPQEAVNKAKSDFLEVITSSKDLNLGFDATALKRSQPGNPIMVQELDFAKLLTLDSASSIEQIAGSDKNTIVPLLDNSSVLTIVTLKSSAEGYSIAGLGDAKMAQDLTAVLSNNSNSQKVKVYELANLNATIFEKVSDSVNLYYTDYGDRFSLRQGVSLNQLVETLKADAINFQKLYGDKLNNKRLVR